MQTKKTYRYPIALTIAGSDCSGGAGIQADLKTFAAIGVYGASVITAITAQNTIGVKDVEAVSPHILEEQLCAVFEDLQVDAVKIGMLHDPITAHLVAQALVHYQPNFVVLDPLMISSSGHRLMTEEAVQTVVKELFPLVDLVTPNLDEASYLTKHSIHSEADLGTIGHKLLQMNCRAVLLKGGHLPSTKKRDQLFTTEKATPDQWESATVQTANSHGTGCTLSSAIAAYIALGKTLPEAIGAAKAYLTEAMRQGADVRIGNGCGPLNHQFAPTPLNKFPL